MEKFDNQIFEGNLEKFSAEKPTSIGKSIEKNTILAKKPTDI